MKVDEIRRIAVVGIRTYLLIIIMAEAESDQ